MNMNNGDKKVLRTELAGIEKDLERLTARKLRIETLLSKPDYTLPVSVRDATGKIGLQGGDELAPTLYANFNRALKQADKKTSPLNMTRLWALYHITKVLSKDVSQWSGTLTTSIGKAWNIRISKTGSDTMVYFSKPGHACVHSLFLPRRFTLTDLIGGLDIMSKH